MIDSIRNWEKISYLALSASLALTMSAGAQVQRSADGAGRCTPLAPSMARDVDRAWRALRAGELETAKDAFARVRAACPQNPAALSGLGYLALRRNDLTSARATFDTLLASRPNEVDALIGSALAAYRLGDTTTARLRFQRAAVRAPRDSIVREYLDRLTDPALTAKLPRPTRPTQLRVDARTVSRHFEIHSAGGTWEEFYIKGVNIGAALPGKHPSDFPPNDSTYERWLALVARMGANTIRVYTIHPPHFYQALARWNRAHPRHPLWLIHGVWTELPPGKEDEKYDDPAWRDGFRAEARRVVDLLHGNAALPRRAGHASGVYTDDVSRWVLAYITGREWEPYSIVAYSKQNPNKSSYHGRFIDVPNGNAAEVWLGEENDALLSYELDRYNTIRPLAYTNWPTLDPLHHPTESARQEEDNLRRWPLVESTREFDNDAIGLDATHMRGTTANPAGTFAAYHAYPYYPDFMLLDPNYAQAQSPEGASAYFGYLRELVAHHGEMPVVVAEYGVPSSRGIAHLTPGGRNHGGHSEQAQAEIDARLTREIHAAGAAGGIVFSLIDEWFKKNWLTTEFEQPLDRKRLWFNALDAEESYGVVAMRPGPRQGAIRIDGRRDDWGDRGTAWSTRHDSTAPAGPMTIRDFRITHDEGYVYLSLHVGTIDWSKGHYLVAIDTHGTELGGHTLPYTGARCSTGFEFVIDIAGPNDTQLLVDQPYNLYREATIPGSQPPQVMQRYNRPWESVAHDDARWDTLVVETNRARIGRDGTRFPRQTYQRNRLLFANQDSTSLADWYADAATGIVELRIGWGMLQFLDPSSRFVLQGTQGDGSSPAGVQTDALRFAVAAYDPQNPRSGGALVGCGSGSDSPFAYSWPAWDTPKWHQELKPVFREMQRAFGSLRAPVARAAR